MNLDGLATFCIRQEDYVQAKKLYDEGLVLVKELGDTDMLTSYLMNLGYVLLMEGEVERGETLSKEAVVLIRERGYKIRLPAALDNLGWTALLRGDYERAETIREESLRLCKELGDRDTAVVNFEGLACTAAARGDAERAAKLFGAAQVLYEKVGDWHTPRERALREPYLTIARSRLREAKWEVMLAEGRAMSFEEAVEYALNVEEPDLPVSPPPRISSNDEPVSVLTRREQEVATLVARGLTNRQIARELSISERTSANHVAKIFKKLGLTSRAQIAG